jgi:hypothetical protein
MNKASLQKAEKESSAVNHPLRSPTTLLQSEDPSHQYPKQQKTYKTAEDVQNSMENPSTGSEGSAPLDPHG